MYYDDNADAKLGKVKDPIVKAIKWVKSRNQKEKAVMGCIGGVAVCSHLNIDTLWSQCII